MKRTAVVLLSGAALVALAWLVMDRLIGPPISTDLSRVGQGQPTLVLVFENYSPAGMTAMDTINQVRREYEDELDFLVADIGTPAGSAFASRYQLPNGAAVLLDGQGAPINIYPIGEDAGLLRESLDQDLGR